MRTLDCKTFSSGDSLRLVPWLISLICLLFLAAQSASGQEACPTPAGYVENPLSTPSITAAEVAAKPTPDNLRMFAMAARDYLAPLNPLETVHALCLMRQEGGDWRSGDIFVVLLAAYPPDFVNMRVFFHASTMAHAGLRVKPEIAGGILATAARGRDGGPVPGLGGHAFGAGRYIGLVGFDLQEPHLDPKTIDSHYIPQVTASEVVDRASLKVFVNEALNYVTQLFQDDTYGHELLELLRAVFRDRNGPWISGPVYLFALDPAGYTLFHGAFPDRFEYRVTGTTRDAVTGELLLPKLLAAGDQETGGFVEYYFDNPADDSDSADIPKVTYVHRVDLSVLTSHGPVTQSYYVAAGFYPGAGTGSGVKMTRSCASRGIAARAVQTLDDIQPFVECAAEYLAEHGTEEARRAFNEDERWKHGPTYVFVDGLAESGTDSQTFVYPPDPSREGQLWGEAIDDFGTDLFYEAYRMMSVVDSGWLYYSFPNPATGRKSPKASYVIEIDWDGSPAVIGAGLYARDWPGTCYWDEVSAAALTADPSPETLREFVRCAAMMVESQGYFAKEELESNPRWVKGANYVFVLDMMGNQVMSGNKIRVNGNVTHEWRQGLQFGGRDMIDVANTFGETYVYYRSNNPWTAYQPKVGFLKRIDAQGVPLLVGAGYYAEPGQSASGPSCADNSATAAGVRTRSDVEAFVRCAAEYAEEHGTEEARRAFNEDARWKHGPTYVFVDGIAPSGEDAFTHVFPPDRPARAWSGARRSTASATTTTSNCTASSRSSTRAGSTTRSTTRRQGSGSRRART